MAQKKGPGAGDTGRQGDCSLRLANNSTNTRKAIPRQESIKAELTGADRCTAAGIKVNVGSPVLAMCRKLVAGGYDPAIPLHAYRGDTLCLTVRSIGEGAELRIGSHGVGFERVPECGPAPPVSLNERAGVGSSTIGSSLSGAVLP